jgi:eukaryotic-like serine/threonine-protein kinase
MSIKKYGSLTFLLLSSLCLLLLSACSTPQNYLPPITPTTNSPVPTPSTSCPAPGMGRAAVMPPLTLGGHQVVIYDEVQSNSQSKSNSSASSSIAYYDLSTKKTTSVLDEANQNTVYAQVSADGQWLFFVTQNLTRSASQSIMQLVRIDGKYLQTLYCSTQYIASPQWSSDQKQIAFFVTNGQGFTLLLLNTRTGSIQTELALSASAGFPNIRWLDATRLYLAGQQADQPPNMLSILDTTKGSNQHLSDLLTVVHHSFASFATSSDATKLYLSTCTCSIGGATGPSSITVQPATGGQEQTLYSSAHDAITSIDSVQPTTLLFTVNTEPPAPTENSYPADDGLWKIITDGTGLSHFLTAVPKAIPFFNHYSQFPWSNVSRDGTMYAAETISPAQALVVGSLKGSSPTSIVTTNNPDTTLSIVGWTTM